MPVVTSQRGCFFTTASLSLAGHSKRSEARIVPTSLINKITSSCPYIVLRKISFWFWFNPEIQTAGVSLLQSDNVLKAITLKRSGNTIMLHDDDVFFFSQSS